MALYIANYTQPLSLSGDITIKGDLHMPTANIKESYLNNKPNNISIQGNKKISTIQLPELSTYCYSIFKEKIGTISSLNAIDKKNDSIYVNSFFKETIVLPIHSTVIENKIIKGNFILTAPDSIYIRKNNILEDVVIMAPKIAIEEGFTGTIQVFAKESITIEKEVTLNYPSVVSLLNKEVDKKAFVKIKEDVKIAGVVLLFGNDLLHLENLSLEIEAKGIVMGTIYCSGSLSLKSDVYGSVIASKINHKVPSSTYSNTLVDVAIDINKKPSFFIDMPIFNNSNHNYEIIKKVL